MNASVNKVMLLGRVIADVEPVRTLPGSGSTVTKFRLAVGRSRKNPQTGQWENSDTMFIDCEVFAYADAKRNLVDIVSRYVKKGDSVFVEGRLKLDEWEDKAGGGKRSKHKVDVTDVQFLGGNGGDSQEEGGEQEQPRQQAPQQQQRTQSARTGQSDYDTDIPFGWLVPALTALSSIGSVIV